MGWEKEGARFMEEGEKEGAGLMEEGKEGAWMPYSRCGFTSAKKREIITSFDLLALLFLMQSSIH